MNLYECLCVAKRTGTKVTVYVVGQDPGFAREQAIKQLDRLGYVQDEVQSIQMIAQTGNPTLFKLLILPGK